MGAVCNNNQLLIQAFDDFSQADQFVGGTCGGYHEYQAALLGVHQPVQAGGVTSFQDMDAAADLGQGPAQEVDRNIGEPGANEEYILSVLQFCSLFSSWAWMSTCL